MEKLLDQHCNQTKCTLDRTIPKEVTRSEAAVGIVRQVWKTGFKATNGTRRLPFSHGDLVVVKDGPLKHIVTKNAFATVSDPKPDANQRIEIQYSECFRSFRLPICVEIYPLDC